MEEYKPSTTARDEERKKHAEELERLRQERFQRELEEAEEKANRPKKKVKRRTEYEVECIKAAKEVKGDTYYLVKWVGWAKPNWEPEENLGDCQKLIDAFEIEELKREDEKRELEEQRKQWAEEGHYEVSKILDVEYEKVS